MDNSAISNPKKNLICGFVEPHVVFKTTVVQKKNLLKKPHNYYGFQRPGVLRQTHPRLSNQKSINGIQGSEKPTSEFLKAWMAFFCKSSLRARHGTGKKPETIMMMIPHRPPVTLMVAGVEVSENGWFPWCEREWTWFLRHGNWKLDLRIKKFQGSLLKEFWPLGRHRDPIAVQVIWNRIPLEGPMILRVGRLQGFYDESCAFFDRYIYRNSTSMFNFIHKPGCVVSMSYIL